MTTGTQKRHIDVGAAAELPEGGKIAREIDGRRILVIRSEGQLFACARACTHECFDLDEGAVQLGTLECPLHGAVFDLRTGAAEYGPAEEPIAVYPCSVDAGRILVQVEPQDER
jgi:3-phenylpropionate/trans-cinnamate dioxygenase ferredoxin subunit